MDTARGAFDEAPTPGPARLGSMTVAGVPAASAGPGRDRAIDDWRRSVWAARNDNREPIVALLREWQIA